MSDKVSPDTPKDASYAPRERGLRRRDRILDAATEVFLQSGYEAASLQEIVSRAGGSLATLYRLFGNKEGLFQAMVERKSAHLLQQLEQPRITGKDAADVLNGVGVSFLELALSADALALQRLLIAEAGRNPRLREIYMAIAPERNLRAIADYLEGEVSAGKLQLDDCYLAATQFIGMIKGNYHMRRLMAEEFTLSSQERDTVVHHAVGLFLNGCSSMAPSV